MKIKLSKTLHQHAKHVAVLVQITVALVKIVQAVSIVLNKAVVAEFAKKLLRRKGKLIILFVLKK